MNATELAARRRWRIGIACVMGVVIVVVGWTYAVQVLTAT